jgi:hypothetical protein
LKSSFINSNPHLHKEKEMSGFRKVFLLMAVLVLVAGIASAQTAPLQCVASSGSIPPVRSEGIAEEAGQVIITCTGGLATPNGQPIPRINVQIFMNTNITSKLIGSNLESEALLAIDDPTPCASAGVGCQLVASDVPNLSQPLATGSGQYLGGIPAAGTVSARPNIFVGQQVQTNSVAWLNVPFDPPGTTPNRVLRIMNVRANASKLGFVSGSLPTNFTMIISISGTGAPSLQNNAVTVGAVQKGLYFDVVDVDGKVTTAATYNQCEPDTKHMYLQYKEGFGTAFRKNILSTESQATINTIYNTESMFYNPLFVGTKAAGAGFATQATRLSARFSNVPDNVTLKVPLTITSANGDSATLVGAGTDGSTASTSDGTVALSGHAGAAVWEFSASNEGAASALIVDVQITYKSNPLPGLGTASVAGNYAPVSTVLTASTSAPVPRFIEDPANSTAFTINSCRTDLLFPFVTNTAGFDTGIVISNTSSDPFSTVPQRGACHLYYYGSTAGGGAAPPTQDTGVVTEGAQLILTLSNGGNLGTVATPGFQGYIIATCDFQYAHGFAFVSDLGATRVAEGYLALVMDKDMYDKTAGTTRTKAASETLKH